VDQAGAVDLPVFVINLARDTARREAMAAQLAAIGLTASFVPAVDGRLLTAGDRAAYHRAKCLRVYGVEMLDSEIGCYLSHYRLYQRILRDDLPASLILEDDARLDPATPAILRALLGVAEPAWTVVRLESMRGRLLRPPSSRFVGIRVADLPDGAGLYRLRTHVLGLGAYLIRPAGARRMLEYGARIFSPIDQTMDRFWENGIVPYIVRPFPARQDAAFASSIGARPAGRNAGEPFGVWMRRRAQRLADSLRKRAFNLTT